MQVVIIEKVTNKLVVQVPVSFVNMNYAPDKSEWFDLGWHTAVEDNLVNANERAKYRFDFR